ncbi:efflux RND transporter periplasmic adaptor subunit [Rhodovibrio sodomensis]|uniref:efflux RND transporter periplasmic adaptor subunit n=1 Tax=Rhodovibrio sodomensis TaxID=1088 RepID=UPI0019056883|nr:efflux RND transporter periplasmic adaptor subunit [Rhodovibrio sodomensis]
MRRAALIALATGFVCAAGFGVPPGRAQDGTAARDTARDTAGDGAGDAAGARALAGDPALERLFAPRDGEVGGGLGAFEARALIEPRAEAILSSEIGGRILDLPVDAGDRFAAGDVLVAFDCSFHQAELRAARAELTRAQRTLDNKEQLARLNSVGQLEVALARADVAKAEAQVQTRKLYVDRCTLTAPYDGRVVERPVNAHETVGKDQELMSVIAAGGLKLRLIVPSRWLAWLRTGQRFELTIDETGGTHTAEVTTLGARIDPVSQTLPLEGRLLDTGTGAPRLLPGMSGTARFDPPNG